jgi:hypothetical protein
VERTSQEFDLGVCTCFLSHCVFHCLMIASLVSFKAYKHIFTSPSSVDKVAKATRSGNARIHGMTQVTPASIAYVATQVQVFWLPFNCHLLLYCRPVFPSLPLPYFLGRTRLPTRNVSTTASLTSLMTLTSRRMSENSWCGGTGASSLFVDRFR